MKVALVTDTYAPRVGGIEAQVADLAAALRTAGHDVVVVTATAGPDEPGVLRFPGPGGAVPNPLSRGRVREALAGVDVVHAHMGVVSPLAQLVADDCVARDVPTVVTVHSVLAAAGPVLAPLLRRWAEGGAVLAAVSAVAARDVEKASGAQVLVVPNGVDVASWVAVPRGRRDDDPVTFVCTTRLAERKRVVPLVRAFARVADQVEGGSVRLVVVGHGPLQSLVRQATRRHGVEGLVELVGQVDRPRLREILSAADVFVSPVRLEAFGIAALEARAAGLPVVGYRWSGVAELVEDGVTGLLVDGDTGLAGAMARLATDRGLLARMRQACATRPGYDWSDVLPQVLAAYDRAGGTVR